MHLKRLFILPVIGLFIWGCPMPQAGFERLPDDIQTLSLLGDTLRTPNAGFPERLDIRIDSLIQYSAEQGDTVSLYIWEARRLGYKGEYRKAIQALDIAYSDYAKNEEEYAEILRHIGHRYITLRSFNHAKVELAQAADMIADMEDKTEEDGLPNAQNKPVSTLHTNIWYHLGLAFYLDGEYERAEEAYAKGLEVSGNDDMRVAMIYWYYMTLKRQGKDVAAGELLEDIHAEMDIIENDSYLKLLLVFKGEFEPELLIDDETDELSDATIGYGLGNWHYMNGRKERAQEIWQGVYDKGNWAAFGYIASEAELARLQ